MAPRKNNLRNENDSVEEIEEEDDDEEESIEMPPSLLRKVVVLQKLHADTEDIDVEYKKERIILEKKYRLLREPFLNTRDKIVAGEINVPKVEEDPIEETEEILKGIPGFWLQCLMNHPAIRDIITEEDVPAMEALTNIKCEYNETYVSFTLSFFFDENPYFSNEVLTKTYTVSPDLLDEKSPILTDHAFDEIEWKSPSMNLCMIETKKKQKSKNGKNKGQTRTITLLEPKQSFFQYFSEPVEDEEEEEEEEDEEKPRIKLTPDEDYDIGHYIRTDILNSAVNWYTGEAAMDEDEDNLDYDAFEEDDDENDDDDDQSQKRPGVVALPGGGFAQAPKAAGEGEQPECKQN
eukprot:CAMPEP_0119037828 /NCGR_PEP_ID=MMETSP1177-20130426/6339_1 /TAXON_ID=2985 /ORGANISM="Ochromonas sp, Strain CCMP1899" /LENGTH=348 /DNA_ID=CAMNT_0006999549 /DNA_START=153 /DNA_END=1199 /DNA_ORIENTATION=-